MLKLMKYKVVFIVIFTLALGLVMAPAMAASDDVFGLKPISSSTDGTGGIALGNEDLIVTATRIINVALGLLGIVAVVIILIGGFKWMTAGGNDEGVTEARKLIFSGIIGIAIILSAWAIARFVLVQLGEATGTPGIDVYSTPDTTE